jgi:uncharacterized protein (TIGR03382 family)
VDSFSDGLVSFSVSPVADNFTSTGLTLGQTYNVTLSYSDDTDPNTSLSISTSCTDPSSMPCTFAGSNGSFSLTPTQVGDYSLNITIDDSSGNTNSFDYNLNVASAPVNTPPTIVEITDSEGNSLSGGQIDQTSPLTYDFEKGPYTVTLDYSDAETPAPSVDASCTDPNLNTTPLSPTASTDTSKTYDVPLNSLGQHSIDFTVDDGNGGITTFSYPVDAKDLHAPTLVSLTDGSANDLTSPVSWDLNSGSLYSIDLEVTDSLDPNPRIEATYMHNGSLSPLGSVVNGVSETYGLTLEEGSYTFYFTVTDASGNSNLFTSADLTVSYPTASGTVQPGLQYSFNGGQLSTECNNLSVSGNEIIIAGTECVTNLNNMASTYLASFENTGVNAELNGNGSISTVFGILEGMRSVSNHSDALDVTEPVAMIDGNITGTVYGDLDGVLGQNVEGINYWSDHYLVVTSGTGDTGLIETADTGLIDTGDTNTDTDTDVDTDTIDSGDNDTGVDDGCKGCSTTTNGIPGSMILFGLAAMGVLRRRREEV